MAWHLLRVNRLIPILFVATIVVAFILMMGESDGSTHLKYTTVTGYFLQADPATNSDGFDYTTTNFGLIDRDYDTDIEYDPDHKESQWQRFAHHVSRLNENSDSRTHYKLLFMGRHGEGYHNVAEAFYGTKAWDCYWSLQDGNGTSTWADAHLTPTGEAQALKANAFWAHQISTQKIRTPESYYVSPLTRCGETANLTFSGLELPEEWPFKPVVKELFREAIGVHTCDRRSSKTEIAKSFPSFVFEEGFAEEDPLWSKTLRETDSSQDVRTKTVLDDVFHSDSHTYISISSHSGEIGSLLRVLGHRKFGLGTGQVIPVLVKAEVVDGKPDVTEPEPWQPVETCTSPPQ